MRALFYTWSLFRSNLIILNVAVFLRHPLQNDSWFHKAYNCMDLETGCGLPSTDEKARLTYSKLLKVEFWLAAVRVLAWTNASEKEGFISSKSHIRSWAQFWKQLTLCIYGKPLIISGLLWPFSYFQSWPLLHSIVFVATLDQASGQYSPIHRELGAILKEDLFNIPNLRSNNPDD